jgi:hypothetical protein
MHRKHRQHRALPIRTQLHRTTITAYNERTKHPHVNLGGRNAHDRQYFALNVCLPPAVKTPHQTTQSGATNELSLNE